MNLYFRIINQFSTGMANCLWPESQSCGGELEVLRDVKALKQPLRRHLAVDVPVEDGGREGVAGGAVGWEDVPRPVHRLRPADDRTLVRKICRVPRYIYYRLIDQFRNWWGFWRQKIQLMQVRVKAPVEYKYLDNLNLSVLALVLFLLHTTFVTWFLLDLKNKL